ncbi:fibronectin type III domain-containing protein [Paenibacillus thailandensis]|uniref:Fibronectin type III domain-containing protein n=1 Tax=Paenibacillus thailandensis TaxID=393250 RepID=A0ABW5QUF3_9BACL
MKRRFMLLLCGFLMLTLLLPFQAAAAESDSALAAENSRSGVTMVAGGHHTLALNQNGTVWAWGSNEYGQLGDGSTTNRSTPVQVQGLSSATAIALGDNHSLAIKSDGTVWAWGSNGYGQLGDGSIIERHTPVQVEGLSSVIDIAANFGHSLALKSDGTVWAWGNNELGQLGDGSTTNRSTPVQVQGLDSVIAISAGYGHSLALKSDGTVWAWGNNELGQLGDGSTTNRSTPVQVQGLSSMVDIASGDYHNLAIKSDGTAWAWGTNWLGELGDGSYYPQYTPVQVQDLSSVIDVAAGYEHSVALKSDGTVWIWGNDEFDPWGYGHGWPVQVQELRSVVEIAAGNQHSLAVKNDGTVWAWGKNDYGQLGDGTKTARFTPFQVLGIGEPGPEAPEWPEGDVLTVTDVTYNSVRLNWQPATDETGVDKYLVYQNNTLLATLNGDTRHYDVKGLSSHSSYLFSLIAVDADGNQSAKIDVTVTTADNKGETLLYRFNGSVLDYDESRILWREGDRVLWLYNRADQSQVKVHDGTTAGANYTIDTAKLSADGVVYNIVGRGLSTRYWKDGADQNYFGGWLIDVDGNFAIFNDGDNYVVDVTTGESRSLPIGEAEILEPVYFDLLADGTVVYTDGLSESSLHKSLPDGTLTTYAPLSGYLAYSGALSDGKNIIYKALTSDSEWWELQVRSAKGEITTLVQNPSSTEAQFSDPKTSYQINNGWIAYREYDAEEDRWILYARSPEGVKKQVFATPGDGTPLSIKQLAPDGTVAYTLGDTTYIHSAEGKLLYSFSGPGDLQYRSGTWYRVDGGSLYSIQAANPEEPQWPEGDVLTVTDVTYNSVQLNWQPATDETGIDKYKVYQDNALLETLNGDVNSYEVKGLSPNSSYLFSLVAVDADGNQSVKKEVTVTTAAYAAPGSLHLSDSKTYSDGRYNYEYLLYYGYISSPGQVLSGSWTPPEGYRGVVNVSMISPEGEDYDLCLATVDDNYPSCGPNTEHPDGSEFSTIEVPADNTAEWRVKGHTENDYSPDEKVFVYVSIRYDNR